LTSAGSPSTGSAQLQCASAVSHTAASPSYSLGRFRGAAVLQELRWLYDRRDLAEARRDLAAWLAKWSGKYPKLTGWVEENIDETLTFYRLPRQHHKHLKSTNMLERLNEEIMRRTHVVRIFPNGESCFGNDFQQPLGNEVFRHFQCPTFPPPTGDQPALHIAGRPRP
jgi:hypothetical protein